MTFVKLKVLSISRLGQDDEGNLASNHEAANKDEHKQLCPFEENPGKYEKPNK